MTQKPYVVDELISAKAIAARVEALAREISTHFADTEKLVVVGLLRGSFIFIADLVRELDLPVEVDFLEASSYGNAMESSREVRILKDLRGEIAGRDAEAEILLRTLVDMDLRWPEPDEDWNPRDERERLAADMSLEALQTSYDDTEETVTKAIDSGLEVSEDAVLIRMADKSKDEREAAVEQIESKRAVLLEDMAETLAHKQELLEEKKKSEA